jgi:predicted lipoprotein with Yx(FWY)xxD motif
MRKSLLLILVAPVLLLMAACGSSTSHSSSASAPSATAAASTTSKPSSSAGALSTRTVPGVGTVLVDGKGRTLYAFAPDHATKVTCVGGCAAVWPPLGAPAGSKPSMSGQVKGALVSSDTNPSGGHVVTYAGWPLYTYVGDNGAGTAKGQGLNVNGGQWWVISPEGKVVTGKASSGSGSGSGASNMSSGGGGGSYGY